MFKYERNKLFLPLSSYEVTTNDDPTLETISLTLFVAGCVRRCIGCQNPSLQVITPHNHKNVNISEIKKIIEDKMCLVKGIAFCGGDFIPLYKDQLEILVDFCKSKNLKTILYTGELFENLSEYLKQNVNIIIDGPYDYHRKTNNFPASSNQRCWIDGKLTNYKNLKINKRGEIND